MVIDPEAIQELMATIAPGPSPSNVSPVPSVTPGPIYVESQVATEVGRRSLW